MTSDWTQAASRYAKIACRPKRFTLVATYKDHTALSQTESYHSDLTNLRERITKGIELEPRYYRKNIDTTPDQLLDLFGIKHLHLGGQNSDILIYLLEYNDYVAVLEINDHKHFRSEPIGVLLQAHQGALKHLHAAQAKASEQIDEKAAAAERRSQALSAARVSAKAALDKSKGANAQDDLPKKS